MLKVIGASSLDSLIGESLPSHLNRPDELNLAQYSKGYSESEFLEHFKYAPPSSEPRAALLHRTVPALQLKPMCHPFQVSGQATQKAPVHDTVARGTHQIIRESRCTQAARTALGAAPSKTTKRGSLTHHSHTPKLPYTPELLSTPDLSCTAAAHTPCYALPGPTPAPHRVRTLAPAGQPLRPSVQGDVQPQQGVQDLHRDGVLRNAAAARDPA